MDEEIKSGRGRVNTRFVKLNNGYWLVVNNERIPFQLGMVYQPVPEGKHINDYKDNFRYLYRALLDEDEGGLGHAKMLSRMGVRVIRLYELPINKSLNVKDKDSKDIRELKYIFRRVHEQYGIRFIVGTYTGLYDNLNFHSEKDQRRVYVDTMRLVVTYYLEPWLLGWQIGNENNYYTRSQQRMPQKINLTLSEYYQFMDNVAGAMRDALNGIHGGLINPTAQQIIILGNGDLTEAEAKLIAKMRNIDGVGLNVYRDIEGFERLLRLAHDAIPRPVIISEFGKAGLGNTQEDDQAKYLTDVAELLLKHSSGFYGFGNVLAGFICEATDQAWKKETGITGDAYLGILGKKAQSQLERVSGHFKRKISFLPKTYSPADLIISCWNYLEAKDYNEAIGFSEKVIEFYSDEALVQERNLSSDLKSRGLSMAELLSNKKEMQMLERTYWALHAVGSAHFIKARALYELGRRDEAISEFRSILKNYSNAFSRDREGNYWLFQNAIREQYPEAMVGFGSSISPSLIELAWKNYESQKYGEAVTEAAKVIQLYTTQAKKQESTTSILERPLLTDREIQNNWALNDVATAHFIRALVYHKQRQDSQTKRELIQIRENYQHAYFQDKEGRYWRLLDLLPENKEVSIDLFLDLLPFTSESLIEVAWKSLSLNQYSQAEACAQKAIELYSREAKVQQKAILGFPGLAKIQARRWALDNIGTAHFIRMKIYHKEGNAPKAIEEANMIMNFYPDAMFQLEEGEKIKITSILDREAPLIFLELSALSSSELLKAAAREEETKDYKLALKYARKVIELYGEEARRQQIQYREATSPENNRVLNDVAMAYLIEARILYKQGDHQKSRQIIEAILRSFNNAQVSYVDQSSVRQYKSITEVIHPKYPLLFLDIEVMTSGELLQRAWSYYQTKKNDEALAHIETLLELFDSKSPRKEGINVSSGLYNDLAGAYFLRAQIAIAQGNYPKAVECMRILEKRFSEGRIIGSRGELINISTLIDLDFPTLFIELPDLSPANLLKAGMGSFTRKEYAKALKLVNKVLELFSNQASQEQQKIWQLDPDQIRKRKHDVVDEVGTAYYLAAKVLDKMERSSEAEKLLLEVLRKFPSARIQDKTGRELALASIINPQYPSLFFTMESFSSQELLAATWDSFNQGKNEVALLYTQKILELYEEEAQRQQQMISAGRTLLPTQKWALDAVGSALYIQSKIFLSTGKVSEMRRSLNKITNNYAGAQILGKDGRFWKVNLITHDVYPDIFIRLPDLSSTSLLRAMWDALDKGKIAEAKIYLDKVVELYSDEAGKQEKELEAQKSNVEKGLTQYVILNDVGTAYFMKGKILLDEGRLEEAMAILNHLRLNFRFAQMDDAEGKRWTIVDMIDEKYPEMFILLRSFSSSTLIEAAWGTYHQKDYDKALRYARKIISLYTNEALQQQNTLREQGEKIEAHQPKAQWALNDVAAAHYVIGRIMLEQGDAGGAKQQLEIVLKKYPSAHTQDEKGEYWLIRKGIQNDFPDLFIDLPSVDSRTLILAAWKALEAKQYDKTRAYAQAVIDFYSEEAGSQEKILEEVGKYPKGKSEIAKYWALNDVGTAHYIKGKSYYEQGKPKEAMGEFNVLLQKYSYSQVQDVDGRYWKLRDAVHKLYPDLFEGPVSTQWVHLVLFALVLEGLILIRSVGAVVKKIWRKISPIVEVSKANGEGKDNENRIAKKYVVENESVMAPLDKVIFSALLFVNLFCAFNLLAWWLQPVRMNYYLVQPLLFGALTYIAMFTAIFYVNIWYFVWSMKRPVYIPPESNRKVAMATTFVQGEPLDLLEATLRKMVEVKYPHDTHILDEANSPEVKEIAERLGVIHFTRKGIERYNQPSGRFRAKTKYGNLNAWLDTHGQQYEYVTFMDLDHQPYPHFLHRVLGYFKDPEVGFVQAPQLYKNQSENWIARGGAEQSYYYYGPLQMGLYGNEAPQVNGSHSTFRVNALEDIGGYAAHNADDIVTSILLQGKGWKGIYVPEILAFGLAPATWASYLKQQLRWAHAMFDLLFYQFFKVLRPLKMKQRLGYLMTGVFYFLKVHFLGLLVLPLIAVGMNQPPVNVNTLEFLKYYLPYVVSMGILLIGWSQKFLIRPDQERGIWYRGGFLWIATSPYIAFALVKALLKQHLPRGFTPKETEMGVSYLKSFVPHMIIVVFSVLALIYAQVLESWIWPTKGMRPFLFTSIISLGFLIISSTRWFFEWNMKKSAQKGGGKKLYENPPYHPPFPAMDGVFRVVESAL